LGAMLITKIQLASMERVRIPEEERSDFYLYVDEFQNFATDSFAGILSEARKYRLNLIVAHQYIGQLVTDVSTKVRDAVFGNVGTMILFRIGAADAEYLENEFEPEFVIQDMVNLPNYSVYLKLMVDGITCRPFSAKTLPPFNVEASEDIKDKIIETSRRLYTKPTAVVEVEINRWSGMMTEVSGAKMFPAVCSNCGKSTMVPFEPAKGRPVYCQDCLEKVQSGKMQPVVGRTEERRESQEFSYDLANIGIEFELKKQPQKYSPRPPQISPEKPAEKYTARKLKEVPIPSPIENKVMSLSELNSTERRERADKPEKPKHDSQRPKVDIEELREAIQESLKKALEGEE
ncbi:MAG: TraM recognition domain-containing protein, partial [Candidatus Liptonbacteria bacterium]|nr:TraM recognition domain-containing protein [Candidatus Liptonbacteria bacterium]